ncbi:MAG: hypothetical protein HZB71_00370 [Betaproteobacteria bacterium]|nr:hypothetical protein [Betaproteobacteria bacterium]
MLLLAATSAAWATGFAPIPGVDDVGALVGKKSERIVLTTDDVKILEPVCVLVLSYADEKGARWWLRLQSTRLLDRPEYQMAKGTKSLHHYCWGQIYNFRRLRESDPKKRQQLAQAAARDYDFVVSNPEYLPKDWPWLAKVHTHIGDMRNASEDTAAGITSYQKAISLNPEYDLAYLGLATLYSDMKDSAKAMETVVEGLRHRPESMGLKRRYDQLGGRKPYPEPYPKSPPAAPEEPAPAVVKPEPPPPSLPAPGADAKPSAPAAPGKPKYCRFCP